MTNVEKLYEICFGNPNKLYHAITDLNKEELKEFISRYGKRIPEDCYTVTLDVILTALLPLRLTRSPQDNLTIIQEAYLDILLIKDEEHTGNQHYIPATKEAKARMQVFFDELARREKEYAEWIKGTAEIEEIEKVTKSHPPFPCCPNALEGDHHT